MSFIEAQFPKDISYGSRGGPGYNTTIAVMSGGNESRNQNWEYARHEYDAAYGIKTQARLENLISFFHVVAGKAHGFRYWDPLDYKSCLTASAPSAIDQLIGTGDGVEDEFQLIKNYTQYGYTRSRIILKPVATTVLIAVNDVVKTPTTHYTYSTVTGIVTFTAGNIPTAGQSVKAGYEFDVPVRFDTDVISIAIEDYQTGGSSVPIIEIKQG